MFGRYTGNARLRRRIKKRLIWVLLLQLTPEYSVFILTVHTRRNLSVKKCNFTWYIALTWNVCPLREHRQLRVIRTGCKREYWDKRRICTRIMQKLHKEKSHTLLFCINPLNPELNPICYLLALLAHYFLHVSRIRVKSLTLRLLYIYMYIYIYIWSTYSWCF